MCTVTVSRTVALLAAACALTATAAGCSGPKANQNLPKPPVVYPTRLAHSPSVSPAVRAAATAAQEAFDRYAAGDYAGAWETYTAEGQKAITKADFVKFNTACPPSFLHSTPKVVGLRLESITEAVARIQIGSTVAAYTLKFESQHWRVQPSDQALATWKQGVDKAIEKEKAAGKCG
jgi:hypothetical protein